MKPVIAINFKSYLNAFGKKAGKILEYVDKFSLEYGIETIVALPLTELYRGKEVKSVKVYSQTAHAVDFGAYTGKIPVKALLHYNVHGVVVNHSEDERVLSEIETIIAHAKDSNLEVLVCAHSPASAISMGRYNIDYVAYEPPELIGTGRSVSQYRGRDIKDIVKYLSHLNSKASLLVGAGITTRKDIDISLQLGAKGVFVASAIMKSSSIEQKLEEFFAYW